MRDAIRALSIRTEASIVLGLAFGYFILGAVASLFSRAAPSISQQHLNFLLGFETVAMLLLGSFLYVRGWSFKRIGFKPGRMDTLKGVGLAALAYACYALIWMLLVFAHASPTYLHGGRSLVIGALALPTVVAVGLLNPLFEEIFVCGYVITLAKESDRLSAGVNASVAIRLAYHLYQGGIGVIGIIPFGLVCAWWFARTGRLWPVVVAHVVFDLTSLLRYVHSNL